MAKRLDHVGVVVADLVQARRFVEHVLGLECVRAASLPEQHLDVAFFACGDVTIELIEVHDADARRERLGDATARIEHIAIAVGDLEATVEALRGHGVQTTTDAPVGALGALNYWTRAHTSGGVTYQLLERTPQVAGTKCGLRAAR